MSTPPGLTCQPSAYWLRDLEQVMHVSQSCCKVTGVNTRRSLEQCLLPADQAITEPILSGSITKPCGFLICKMGTALALRSPQRKRRIFMKGLAKVCVLLSNTPCIAFVTVPIKEAQPCPVQGGGP